jgi:ubiquinone/menaquinone biosynthesis C-methylase UbiE
MTTQKSQWQTKELAASFLEGVRGAMPCADLQLSVMGKIARHWRKKPKIILDLGCGNGILGRYLMGIFPKALGVFVDFSDPMLDAIWKNVNNSALARVIKADFGNSDWIQAVLPATPFDIVVSGFAIHHQPNTRKRALYSEIYKFLSPGGIFLNLEHVSSPTPAVERIFDDFFVDHLFEYHSKLDKTKSRENVLETYYNRPDKKENILAPVEDQCRWLREIGFKDVDCFFKIFELSLFGGRKTEQI